MDARDHAIYENEAFSVGPHRKPVSPETYIAVLKKEAQDQYPTFLDVLEQGGVRGLSAIFDAVAGAADKFSDDPNKIFWLINVTDDRVTDLNMTHSQGSYPHVHIVGGNLADDKLHVATEKTYTPQPKDDFNEGFKAREDKFTKMDQMGPFTVYEVPEEYAESPHHIVVTSNEFENFKDFTENAGAQEVYYLKTLLHKYLTPEVPQGGARLINDDKFHPTGQFTLRIQGGDQQRRWFQKPSGP